eukprot:snap_masked-scaffold_7-processed-gene-14.14-mRNA-1 protein AED:1.00 eAED:1.00 QI:0/0/0/0/1/1/2/0/62
MDRIGILRKIVSRTPNRKEKGPGLVTDVAEMTDSRFLSSLFLFNIFLKNNLDALSTLHSIGS